MKLTTNIIFSLLLIFVIVSCDKFKQLEKLEGQQGLFIGTWKFISLLAESTEGDLFLPYGENLYGKLMYESKGHMSVFLMRPNRPKFASGDIYNGTPEEIKFSFENFDAYCGTYKVDTENKTITHVIEGSRFPNWEGTEQVRYYEFNNDTLVLSASLSLLGKEWSLRASLVKL